MRFVVALKSQQPTILFFNQSLLTSAVEVNAGTAVQHIVVLHSPEEMTRLPSFRISRFVRRRVDGHFVDEIVSAYQILR